jgi:hypothetical protein
MLQQDLLFYPVLLKRLCFLETLGGSSVAGEHTTRDLLCNVTPGRRSVPLDRSKRGYTVPDQKIRKVCKGSACTVCATKVQLVVLYPRCEPMKDPLGPRQSLRLGLGALS